jgi:hypothetical protein
MTKTPGRAATGHPGAGQCMHANGNQIPGRAQR